MLKIKTLDDKKAGNRQRDWDPLQNNVLQQDILCSLIKNDFMVRI